MTKRTDEELWKAIIGKRDVEAWKEFVDFESMSDFEKDWSLMEFENLTADNREELQKNPNMLLHERMGKMINLALKHNIDPIKPYNEAVTRRAEIKAKHRKGV